MSETDTEHEFSTLNGGKVTLVQSQDCHGFQMREAADHVVIIVDGIEHQLSPGETWRIDANGISKTS